MTRLRSIALLISVAITRRASALCLSLPLLRTPRCASRRRAAALVVSARVDGDDGAPPSSSALALTSALARYDAAWRRDGDGEQADGSRWTFLDDANAWVLEPDGGRTTPWGVVHFVGGAVLGAFPQVAYGELLQRLAAATRVAVVATPYELGLDHTKLARATGAAFDAALDEMSGRRGWPPPPRDGDDDGLPRLQCVALGHSLGGKLLLLELAEQAAQATAARAEATGDRRGGRIDDAPPSTRDLEEDEATSPQSAFAKRQAARRARQEQQEQEQQPEPPPLSDASERGVGGGVGFGGAVDPTRRSDATRCTKVALLAPNNFGLADSARMIDSFVDEFLSQQAQAQPPPSPQPGGGGGGMNDDVWGGNGGGALSEVKRPWASS